MYKELCLKWLNKMTDKLPREIHIKQLLVDSMLCFSFDRPVTDNCPILVLILDCIDFTILMTGPRLSLKCSAQDFSVDLLDMQDTPQIYPFSHQSDTFGSSCLSDYVLRYQIL